MDKPNSNTNELKKSPIERILGGFRSLGARIRDTYEKAKLLLSRAAAFLSSSRAVRLRERLLRFCLTTLIGLLLSRASLPLDARPFGLALLAASSGNAAAAMVGLCLAPLTLGGEDFWVTLAVAAGMLLLRVLMRLLADPPEDGLSSLADLFSENTYLRLTVSAVAAFAVGLVHMVTDGFYYHTLAGALLSTVAAPLLCAALLPLEYDLDELDARPVRAYICRSVLYLGITLSLSGTSLLGLELSYTVAAAFCLVEARRMRLLPSALLGAVLGLAGGGLWPMVFAFSSSVACLLWKYAPIGASLISMFSLAALGSLLCGIDGFLNAFPAAFIGSTAALVCLKLADAVAEAKKRPISAEPDGEALHVMRGDLDMLSVAFGELGRSFKSLSDKRKKPSVESLRALCSEVCDGVCSSCRNYRLCWEVEELSSRELLASMSLIMHERGRLEPSDLPLYMRRRCPSLGRIIPLINSSADALLRRAISDAGLDSISADYTAISEILAEAKRENIAEYSVNAELSREFSAMLVSSGVKMQSATVWGNRRLEVGARAPDFRASRLSPNELRERTERITGTHLTDPLLRRDGQGDMILRMSAIRSFSAICASASEGASGSVCGDTVTTLTTDDGRFYAILCDGMGSGEEAALASSVCSIFLKKLLSAKNSVRTALSLLDSIIRSGKIAGECSVAVDILSLDLYSGEATVYKSGAARTLIKRGERIFSLQGRSAPIGILDGFDGHATDFRVKPGDILLVMSDGIDDISGADGGEAHERWLLDLLAACPGGTPALETAAHRIIRSARSSGSRDDTSVILIEVTEYEESC